MSVRNSAHRARRYGSEAPGARLADDAPRRRELVPQHLIDRARAAQPLAETIGAEVALKRNGHHWRGLCPFHGEKTPSFWVFGDHYHCFGCGAHGDAIIWRMRAAGESFVEAVRALLGEGGAERTTLRVAAAPSGRSDASPRDNVTRAREIWRRAFAIDGTPGEAYLRARGIRQKLPPTLRFDPALAWSDLGIEDPAERRRRARRMPGIVAAVQAPDGKIVAVHRIYLGPDAARTGRAFDKRLLGRPAGAAVRLAAADVRMGLSEGIETGLAVMEAMPGFPVWAAIAASFLPLVDLPERVTLPVLLADRDKVSWKPGPLYGQRPGEYWATRAAARHLEEGRRPVIARPPGDKADFNDLLEAV